MKKFAVEGLGTFALTLTVILSLTGTFPVPTPVLAALVVGLFIYSMGHISGIHINPAVTIGLWTAGKINNSDAIGYICSQFLGAASAYILASALIPTSTMERLVVENSLRVGFAELLGTFFLLLGIASVVYKKAPLGTSGIVIGGSVLFGVTIASLLGSNGIINPAVALGLGSFGIMYIIGPILGAIIAMKVYKALDH